MPATQGTGFPELTHYILVELQRKNIPPCAICSLFNRIVNLEQKVISKSKDGMVKKSSVHSIFSTSFLFLTLFYTSGVHREVES